VVENRISNTFMIMQWMIIVYGTLVFHSLPRVSAQWFLHSKKVLPRLTVKWDWVYAYFRPLLCLSRSLHFLCGLIITSVCCLDVDMSLHFSFLRGMLDKFLSSIYQLYHIHLILCKVLATFVVVAMPQGSHTNT
jgi:hypothetical protein